MTEEGVCAALCALKGIEPDAEVAKKHRAAILGISKGRNSLPTMTPKPFWKSKTVWFNGLTILIAVATIFGFTINQELFAEVTGVLVALSPIVNLILRFFTKQPVTAEPVPTPTDPLA